jgi:hypothetical protein
MVLRAQRDLRFPNCEAILLIEAKRDPYGVEIRESS